MKHRRIEILRTGMLVLSAVLFAALVWVLWRTIPWSGHGISGGRFRCLPTTYARRSTPCFPAGSRRTISPTRTA